MSNDWTEATVVADTEPAEDGASPTTIAFDRDRILQVNSQFLFAPGTPPYTVSVVRGLP